MFILLVLETVAWTSTTMLICSRSQSVRPKNCSSPNYPAPPLHMRIGCPRFYTYTRLWSALVLPSTLVSAIWRQTCRQLIYSRAMLKGHAAWRTPAPELINLPDQYVMGSEGGSVAVGAGTFETAGEKVVNIPLLRTFCFSTSVIWGTSLLMSFLESPKYLIYPLNMQRTFSILILKEENQFIKSRMYSIAPKYCWQEKYQTWTTTMV